MFQKSGFRSAVSRCTRTLNLSIVNFSIAESFTDTMVHIDRNVINFLTFKERARKELLQCIDNCPGTKALVWDDYLIGPFSQLADYTVLQDHQVTRMFTLAKSEFPSNLDFTSMIFLVRAELKIVKRIAKFLAKAAAVKKASLPKIYVCFVPAISTVCQKALIENLPATAQLVHEFRACAVGAIPLETDVLSLELESSFRGLYLEEDPSSLHHLATAVNDVQKVHGVIPNLYGKGKYAKQLIDMVGKLGKDAASSEWNIASRFDNLFIIDRTVDLITLMPTQLTYEGLIDECFGIHQATVRLPADKFPNMGTSSKNPDQSESGRKDAPEKKIILNSSDELYTEIRDLNFSAVGPVFSGKAKMLNAKLGERFSAKEVAEMKEFVAKMPHLLSLKQSLTTFMTVAELIKPFVSNDNFLESLEVQQGFLSGQDADKVHPYIEQLIAQCEPIDQVIRLIVLQSEVNGGLKPPILAQYKRDIIHSYGFEEIISLNNMEKAGLFRTANKKWYRTAKDSLKLFVEHSSNSAAKDISYIFSGYAPLSVRLAKHLVFPGWRSINELLEAIPGEKTEAKQKIAEHLRKRRSSISSSVSSASEDPAVVTLVVFIGGVTYSEVSALRHLSNQEDTSSIFYVLTTEMLNGTSLIKSLKETLKTTIV